MRTLDRLHTTPLVFDPSLQNILTKNTTNTVKGYETPEYDGDDAELFEAFVAGFMCSGEGENAEYPHDYDENRIRAELAEDFEDWRGGE